MAASLMELVEKVNKGEMVEANLLEVYQESANSAERFLAHHCRAMLDLRRAQQHMLQSLEAIDYSDQKVLNQFISISTFLGFSDLRAGPIVKFGTSAINRREYALGLEALQNGVTGDLSQGGTYTADRENCLLIASQYQRVAQCVGFAPSGDLQWNNPQTRVAWIVSGICDDEPVARTLSGLARFIDPSKFALSVYSTESSVRRDKQQFYQSNYVGSSSKRGTVTIENIQERGVNTWIAPTDGDVITCTRALAEQLVRDQIDVAIFDVNQSDPIAAVTACWDVAKVKINFCRRTPLYAPGMSSVVYFDPSRWESDKDFWIRQNMESRFILEGCDVDQHLGTPPLRSAYGIPEAAVVLATAGADLETHVTGEFVETVINILRAHPNAIYLLIGEGELAWQKRKFESAGVGKRVGYAGKRRDLPGFLRICDIYLAEFPTACPSGIIGAMSVERPVVAASRWGQESQAAQAAALVGNEASVPGGDTGTYIERVSKLVREPVYRHRLGKSLRQRVEQHFSFAQTARHIEQLCDQSIQNRTETTVTEEPERLAEVA